MFRYPLNELIKKIRSIGWEVEIISENRFEINVGAKHLTLFISDYNRYNDYDVCEGLLKTPNAFIEGEPVPAVAELLAVMFPDKEIREVDGSMIYRNGQGRFDLLCGEPDGLFIKERLICSGLVKNSSRSLAFEELDKTDHSLVYNAVQHIASLKENIRTKNLLRIVKLTENIDSLILHIMGARIREGKVYHFNTKFVIGDKDGYYKGFEEKLPIPSDLLAIQSSADFVKNPLNRSCWTILEMDDEPLYEGSELFVDVDENHYVLLGEYWARVTGDWLVNPHTPKPESLQNEILMYLNMQDQERDSNESNLRSSSIFGSNNW